MPEKVTSITEELARSRDRLYQRLLIGGVSVAVILLALSACSAANPDGVQALPTRTPKPTFTSTPRATELSYAFATATPRASETPTPPKKPTPTETSTSTPTKTSMPEAKKTATPTYQVVVRPTEVVIKLPPTQIPPPKETAKPSMPFAFVPEAMKADPNCGAVYFKGKVVDENGEPVNGQVVRLTFWGNEVFRVTGENGEDPGAFGFTPLSRDKYRSPTKFEIGLVADVRNATPVSDKVQINFRDCDVAGQFTNIIFEKAN